MFPGNKTEPKSSLHDAKKAFEELYLEKSGNEWEDHHSFVKIPGKMYPVDLDYGSDANDNFNLAETEESKLAKPVQVRGFWENSRF